MTARRAAPAHPLDLDGVDVIVAADPRALKMWGVVALSPRAREVLGAPRRMFAGQPPGAALQQLGLKVLGLRGGRARRCLAWSAGGPRLVNIQGTEK